MNMLEALHPHQEDNLHLRLHRARSVVLTSEELVEVRAAQRTFEGAYMRTALSQFSLSLIILKIFTSEFYSVGALFAVYGAAVMLVAAYRRYEGNRQFFDDEVTEEESYAEADGRTRSVRRSVVVKKKFRTSGNAVGLLVVLSLGAYITLMVLVWQIVS
ncbi:hypothetical protein NKR19_g961 [Coniochaeta hoffmannii]|uniref:DUF202 domain-containing protein n=1 Tax=Coniochaeta hoffmannii TaxID=91930 RepID=A0AA38S1W1_9PEZI|nr:hypothetical protein NKR19_g961 [Coniochaeta hoffmannii]